MNASETPPPRRRWLWPVLIISLALNLLIVGVFIGAALRANSADRPPGSTRSLIGEPFIRALEPADRRAFVRGMIPDRETLRSNRADLRARLETLLDALSAEDFDRDRVADILADQRTLALRRQVIGEALLLDRLEAMSVDARRAYAERLAEALRRPRRRD